MAAAVSTWIFQPEDRSQMWAGSCHVAWPCCLGGMGIGLLLPVIEFKGCCFIWFRVISYAWSFCHVSKFAGYCFFGFWFLFFVFLMKKHIWISCRNRPTFYFIDSIWSEKWTINPNLIPIWTHRFTVVYILLQIHPWIMTYSWLHELETGCIPATFKHGYLIYRKYI